MSERTTQTLDEQACEWVDRVGTDDMSARIASAAHDQNPRHASPKDILDILLHNGYVAGHRSRDAEVEALVKALRVFISHHDSYDFVHDYQVAQFRELLAPYPEKEP